jgi:hypothetical protein
VRKGSQGTRHTAVVGREVRRVLLGAHPDFPSSAKATDPSRDPVIMPFIRQESAELSLSPNCRVHEFRKKYPKRYETLLKTCCDLGGCFDEVVLRFHNVHRGHVRALLMMQERMDSG